MRTTAVTKSLRKIRNNPPKRDSPTKNKGNHVYFFNLNYGKL